MIKRGIRCYQYLFLTSHFNTAFKNANKNKNIMISSSLIFHNRIKSSHYSARRWALCLALSDGLSNVVAHLSTSSKDDEGKKMKLPEEPQNCCMSGCANCVWVVYAEELAKIFNDGGETAKQKIIEHVKDPNLRAFLMLELSHLFKKKE